MNSYISIFKKEMSSKEASFRILIFIPILILLVSLFIVLIDPYQFIHKSFLSEVHFSKKQRYQTPGLIRNYPASNYIVGTSMSENFNAKAASEIFKNGSFQQLTISGLLPKNFSTVLNLLLKKNQPKMVVMDLHWYFESLDPDAESAQHKFPNFMYTESGVDTLKYVFNHDVLKESFRLLVGDIDPDDFQADLNSLNRWMDESLFEEYNTEDNMSARQKILFKNSENLVSEKIMRDGKTFNYPSIDKNLLPLISKYKETKFIIFLPPYSTWYYASNTGKTFINRLIYMRKYIADKLSDEKNVKVFGFDLEKSIVNNEKNYKDYGHYHAKVNNFILKNIHIGNGLLNSKNSSDYLIKMINNINEYKINNIGDKRVKPKE